MKTMWRAVLAAAILALGACAPRVLDPKAEAAGKAAYAELSAGDYVALEARLAPEARTHATLAALRQTGAELPEGAPQAVKTADWSTERNFSGAASYEIVNLSQDFVYADRTVRVDTRLTRPIEDTAKGLHGPFLLTAEIKPTGDGSFQVLSLQASAQ